MTEEESATGPGKIPELSAGGKVKDADSTNQLSRLKGVHAAWNGALERRTLAADHGATQEALRYYRVGVERLLLEIEAVAERADAKEVWQDRDLGEITLEVPREVQDAYEARDVRILHTNRPPEPIPVSIKGLADILEVEWPLKVAWELNTSAGSGQRETIIGVSEREPSMKVLDNAIRSLRSLLGAVGLDLEFGGDYFGVGGDDAL